ncbi:hypothetical protein Glove_91g97 [Diversispora epigaea]|uniref:Cytochrome P450 n=1 Tax=Diversispora epigaea TaxID=1348612 RepID=A0A397JEF1_9GLOM|nr:hypothetical protein Glove_91g97 [Diversispora epigaea]
MFIIYGVYFSLFYFLYYIIKKFFIIPPELRQIPSLPLIQTVQLNLKFYLAREPLLDVIRHYLIESLNKYGILKYFDILMRKWVIVISKPELMKEVFQRADTFLKSERNEHKISKAELKFIGYDNLLYEIKEASHLRHRRVSNPAFSHGWPPELFGKLAIELFEVMDKASEKSPSFDIFHFTKSFALDEHKISKAELKFIGYDNLLYEIKEASHLRHRRVSNPAFSHGWPPELFGKLAIELFEVMDKASEKSPSFDIFHFTKSFALDVLGLATFGYNFRGTRGIRKSGSELEKAYLTAVYGMSDMKYVLFPILEKIPGFRRPELFNRIDYLSGVMLDIIKERKQNLKFKKVNNDDYDGPRDLLYYMLKAEET